jgi:hypothetical protein
MSGRGSDKPQQRIGKGDDVTPEQRERLKRIAKHNEPTEADTDDALVNLSKLDHPDYDSDAEIQALHPDWFRNTQTVANSDTTTHCCPSCGENRTDYLWWNAAGDELTCQTCGCVFQVP